MIIWNKISNKVIVIMKSLLTKTVRIKSNNNNIEKKISNKIKVIMNSILSQIVMKIKNENIE